MRALFVTVVLGLLAPARAPAQNGSQFQDWHPPSSEIGLKPKIGCADLRSLTTYESFRSSPRP